MTTGLTADHGERSPEWSTGLTPAYPRPNEPRLEKPVVPGVIDTRTGLTPTYTFVQGYASPLARRLTPKGDDASPLARRSWIKPLVQGRSIWSQERQYPARLSDG